MKKILSILLATLLIAGLVPFVFLSAAAGTSETASASTAINEGMNGRIYHYYQSFDTDTAVQGAAKVIEALGWTVPSGKASNHNANVTATETGNDAVPMFEVKNGQLYLRNHGSADEQVLICTADVLAEVNGPFTVEYTVTLLASSYSTEDGAFSFLYQSTDSMSAYGEVALRISGWGEHTATTGVLDAGDVSLSNVKQTSMHAYMLNNITNPSLYERLYGDLDELPNSANLVDLRGTNTMVGKELRVRLDFDGELAPQVYVNDILVSDPHNIEGGALANTVAANYEALKTAGGYALGFRLSPGVDCVVDEITLYEERDAGASGLFITEIATLPDNAQAPYIEIYNGGDETVDLADYVGGYASIYRNGATAVKTVAYGDYIGKTLTVGEDVTLNNLSATDALLAPGEVVLVFPVDTAADMASLVSTVNGVTMAGFRAEYGLDASAKILAIPCGSSSYTDEEETVPLTNELVMDATEYRAWFVGTLENAYGNEIDWAAYDLDAIAACADSVIKLVPTIAFGADLAIDTTAYVINATTNKAQYLFGNDGMVQSGYSAHYIYGADAHATPNTGLMISRCTETIDEQANVGALLSVQEAYFAKLAAYRNGDVVSGAPAITEMVPRTAENDAFESFEITNLSDAPINLYDYALISSGNTKYGDVSNWTLSTLLEKTPVAGITNPATAGDIYMLEPGESVVVWNMTVEGYTLSEFRSYYNLSYSVPVIVADSTDEGAVVIANEGTVSYGMALKSDLTDAVSDVTVPLHSVYYSVSAQKYTWNDLYESNPAVFNLMIHEAFTGCEMLGEFLTVGASLAGYFTREQVTDAAGLTYYAYTLCADDATVTAETEGVYYKLSNPDSFFAYVGEQETTIPEGYAVDLSYGQTMTAGTLSGAVLSALDVIEYAYDSTDHSYTAIPYVSKVADYFVAVEGIGGATKNHTLSRTLSGQGVDARVRYAYYDVVYLDGSGNQTAVVSVNSVTGNDIYVTLTDAYSNWLVNNVAYEAGATVAICGDTVVRPGQQGASVQSGVNNTLGNQTSGADTRPADPTPDTSVENTTLNVNMAPDSMDPADANRISVGAVVAIVLGSVAVLSLGGWLVYKKMKAKA